MYVNRYALQHLSVVDGVVLTSDFEPFNRMAYSRFKYGYLPPAVEYGQGLARLISEELFDRAGAGPIRIVSAPYKYLPTASHAIAQVLTRELSRIAIKQGIEPPKLVPFHKSRMGSNSYAQSSEADRLRSLATLGLRIDENLIRNTHVLIVDDIRITGSAEKATAEFMESLNPQGVWYLHAARLPEAVGKANPSLENELNQSYPHSASWVLQDVTSGQFQLNTRVLRHVLEYGELEFRVFLDGAPDALLQEMYDAGLGNGLAYYRKYTIPLESIQTELTSRAKERFYAAV